MFLDFIVCRFIFTQHRHPGNVFVINLIIETEIKCCHFYFMSEVNNLLVFQYCLFIFFWKMETDIYLMRFIDEKFVQLKP